MALGLDGLLFGVCLVSNGSRIVAEAPEPYISQYNERYYLLPILVESDFNVIAFLQYLLE